VQWEELLQSLSNQHQQWLNYEISLLKSKYYLPTPVHFSDWSSVIVHLHTPSLHSPASLQSALVEHLNAVEGGEKTVNSKGNLCLNTQCTEVGRAFLIHFQKIFFKMGFYTSKLAKELKFYAWIIIQGYKSLKKGQKMLKIATNLVYDAFFKKKFVLANLRINNWL